MLFKGWRMSTLLRIDKSNRLKDEGLFEKLLSK